MQKKVIVEVSPYVNSLYNRYNGDMTKKQWLKKEKIGQKAIEYVKNKLSEHEFYQLDNAAFTFKQFDISTFEVEISFNWTEKENIHVWRNEVKEDCIVITSVFAGKFIVSIA
mgnify:CR=1 FL=1